MLLARRASRCPVFRPRAGAAGFRGSAAEGQPMARFTVHLWFTPDAEGSDTGTIAMRCTRIDEGLRGIGMIGEHDGIDVRSYRGPELVMGTAYLRGNSRDHDNATTTIKGNRTLYTRYIAALRAAGGEVIEGDPEEPAVGPEPAKDTTGAATATFTFAATTENAEPRATSEERCEYSVRILGEDDGDTDTFVLTIHLTRAELADLVADLIRKG